MRWIAAIMLLLHASVSWAEDVAIRTGEHQDFSRLVFSISPEVDWELSPSGNGYVLTLSDPQIRYVTASVFERIPRDRIAQVVDDGQGRLELILACDPCYADAFRWQPDRLVVDIVDGLDPTAAPISSARDVAQVPVLPLLPSARSALERAQTDVFHSPLDEALAETPQVQYSEKGLAESIARAVSQGLLEPALSAVTPEPPAPMASRVAPPVPDNQPPLTGPQTPGVEVGSAMERDLSALGLALGNLTVDPCLPAAAFDVSEWADETPFSMQIANLSRGVAVEMDQVSEEAVLRLARGYIHFGFGYEALQTLDLLGTNSQERAILESMARIVDSMPQSTEFFASQRECTNGAGPWVVASGAAPFAEVDRNALLQSFRLLPSALQGLLAPSLSKASLEADDAEAAALILSSVQDGDAAARPEVREARAALSQASGGPAAALSLLQEQSKEDARISPAAVAQMITLTVDSGGTPSPDDLLLAETMRREYRTDPVASQLASAEARGRAANGEFAAAFALIEGDASDPPAENKEDLFNEIALRMVEESDDAQFLDFSFSPLVEPPSPEVENTIARRLIALNFPEKAQDYLHGPARSEAMAERRYLRSEAALLLGNPEEALVHIKGLSDSRAEALRAQALVQMGDLSGAYAVAGPGSENAPDLDAAFRAGAWDRLSLSGDPLLSEVANDVLSDENSTKFDGLADRQATLEEARATRARMSSLLERFTFDPVATN